MAEGTATYSTGYHADTMHSDFADNLGALRQQPTKIQFRTVRFVHSVDHDQTSLVSKGKAIFCLEVQQNFLPRQGVTRTTRSLNVPVKFNFNSKNLIFNLQYASTINIRRRRTAITKKCFTLMYQGPDRKSMRT